MRLKYMHSIISIQTGQVLMFLKSALEKIILDPRYHDILTLVKGMRNGIVYGTKVRFPHALVYETSLICLLGLSLTGPSLRMIFLFRSGSYVLPSSVHMHNPRRQQDHILKAFFT